MRYINPQFTLHYITLPLQLMADPSATHAVWVIIGHVGPRDVIVVLVFAFIRDWKLEQHRKAASRIAYLNTAIWQLSSITAKATARWIFSV